MTTTIDPRVGTDLAGYRLESVLGRGGMGVVYLATDLRLERKVALKLVAPALAGDPRFRERFLRESRLAASLDHSHIVPVYGAGETDGQLWIAMRYVQGTDLRSLLEAEGPLEPARAVELCSQVGDALDAAHAHVLVHRDVKPANVLVTEEGGEEHCYLADFGLARSPSEEHAVAPPHLSGTVDYTAPEQIAAEPADQQADVYSLGCVFYECLVGQPPFKRARPAATLFAHASEPPPSLYERRPELPEGIDAVIDKTLAKEPGERYETCGELCRAAETALGLGRPRFTRRQLVLAGTGAALAVAAAAAVPAVLLTRREGTASPPPAILPVSEDSLVRIDPQTGEAIAATPVDASPVGVAADGESVWIIGTGNRGLSQISPETGAVAMTIALTNSPRRIATGNGAVWVVTDWNAAGDGVLRYEPGTESPSPLRDDILFPGDIVAGHGSVWVVGTTGPASEALVRVDPSTEAIAASFSGDSLGAGNPASALWLAIAEDGVWAASQLGRVAHIDPATNSVIASYDVSASLDDIAAGEGAVWAMNALEDAVLQIDPATDQVTGTVRVGRGPTAIAAGAGAAWVTSGRDGTLTRIDPTTSDVETIDLGAAATAVAVGLGSVWVTVDVR